VVVITRNNAQVPICAFDKLLAIIMNVNKPNKVVANLWKKVKKIDLTQ
jgi:hypothetical protein